MAKRTMLAILVMIFITAVSCNLDSEDGIFHRISGSQAAEANQDVIQIAGTLLGDIVYLTRDGLFVEADGEDRMIWCDTTSKPVSSCIADNTAYVLLPSGSIMKLDGNTWRSADSGVSSLQSNGFYMKSDGSLWHVLQQASLSPANYAYILGSGDHVLAVSTDGIDIIGTDGSSHADHDYVKFFGFQEISSNSFIAVGCVGSLTKSYLMTRSDSVLTITEIDAEPSSYSSTTRQAASFLYSSQSRTIVSFKCADCFDEYDVTDLGAVAMSSRTDGYATSTRGMRFGSVFKVSEGSYVCAAFENGMVRLETT